MNNIDKNLDFAKTERRTPLFIATLLNFHTGTPLTGSPGEADVLKAMLKERLIVKFERYYLTNLGIAYIELILRTPVPFVKYIDPRLLGE